MRISEGERIAIQGVVAYGSHYGYGNMISHLKTTWAGVLMAEGLPEKTAWAAVGGKGYPFQIHIDLMERGEWDETGERYRKQAAPIGRARPVARKASARSPRRRSK